jgi:ATP-dependent Clp protease ATP-binding subunit ClpC
MKKELLGEVEKHFRPEFLNRLDDTIVFHPLTREDLRSIVDIELRHVQQRLKQQGFAVSISDDVRDFLIEKGYNPDFGARPLRRAIEQFIEDPLAEEILRGAFVGKGLVAISMKDSHPFFDFIRDPSEGEAAKPVEASSS